MISDQIIRVTVDLRESDAVAIEQGRPILILGFAFWHHERSTPCNPDLWDPRRFLGGSLIQKQSVAAAIARGMYCYWLERYQQKHS